MRQRAGALAGFVLCLAGIAPAQAVEKGLSANFGYVSDYVFRGVEQANSSGSAGMDAYYGPLYAGVFTIDVGKGLEYDLYGGFNFHWDDFGLDLNYTRYNFTEDDPRYEIIGGEVVLDDTSFFADTSQEGNITLAYGPISATFTRGVDDNFKGQVPGNDKIDYTIGVVRGDYRGFSLSYGQYGMDLDGKWWELGYSMEVVGFNAGIKVVVTDNDLGNEEYIVFSLRRVFDVMGILQDEESPPPEEGGEEEDFLVRPPQLLD